MNKIIKKNKMRIKKTRKKIKKLGYRFFNSFYVKYYLADIDADKTLFTSKNGCDLAGNMLRLMIEANRTKAPKMKIGVAAEPQQEGIIRELLKNNGLDDVEIVKYDSLNYYKWLETSKYLFCDSTLPGRFIKKSGQIYVNTWHGTPFKKMGNDSQSDRHMMGNVQRNLLNTDIFVFPSDYCKEKMLGAYHITDIYQGDIACVGYPRNSIFLDESSRASVRSRYELDGKKVYIYMPTYREAKTARRIVNQSSQIEEFLDEIDVQLDEDEIMFVKLHVFNERNIDFSKYRKIKEFPLGIETYEFLNAADVLISDYSSVMYDFANTGRLIVRFVYDEKEYFKNRGVYEQPVEMPFPKVYDVKNLVTALRKGKTYDDAPFIKAYCQYDNVDSARMIIEKAYNYERKENDDKKEITYIYDERIKKGIVNENLEKVIADNPDLNPFLVFSKKKLAKRRANYSNIPRNVEGVLAINNVFYKTAGETIAYILRQRFAINNSWTEKKMNEHYKREYQRLLGNYPIKNAVFYLGYSNATAEVLSHGDCKSTIYVFHHWVNQKKASDIKQILANYDEIVVCDEEMIARIKRAMGQDFDAGRIRVNDYYLNK